jgi:uncharacterized membrane protein YedE/YeeE
MHDFTPISALIGGALIGLAASILLAATGRVAGISGIVGGLLLRTRGDVLWRALFVLGLLIAGLIGLWVAPDALSASPRGLLAVAAAGLLVGVGTKLGNGCTSGHGVCGLSRFSVRSLVATVTFISTGIIAVVVTRALGGGT